MSLPGAPQSVARFRDHGRLAARVLCLVFALVGALPLAAGFVAQSEPVQRWASSETARVLHDLLGVEASFDVELALWPMHLAIDDIRVESTDGGDPLFRADRVSVTPRLFSLLAGRLDVGDIEIDGPRHRLIVRNGKLQNFDIRLPETDGDTRLERAPFASLSVTDAVFDVEVDDLLIRSGSVDLDIFADSGSRYDVALRVPRTTVVHRRALANGTTAHDEDVLCQLDLRLSLEPGSVLVRRLSVLGAADLDPAPGTVPHCKATRDENEPQDHERVGVRLSQLQVQYRQGRPTFVDGHVVARAPLDVINRYVDAPTLHAWAGFTGNVRYDDTHRLPQLDGTFRVSELMVEDVRVVEHAEGDVHVHADRVSVPRLRAGYGGGIVDLTGITVEPLAPGMPFQLSEMKSSGVGIQGLLRDVGITAHSWVRWDWPRIGLKDFGGTLDPLGLEGAVTARTTDFTVFDRGYDDPHRKRMVGVPKADLVGRFAVEPEGIRFKGFRVDFSKSKLLADVSVGFDSRVQLDVREGSRVNLADISPIATLPLSGMIAVEATMDGIVPDVLLRGKVGIQQLELAGFPVGDIQHADVEFKPLKVRFRDLVGTSGASDIVVPALLLDFESDADVSVEGTLTSKALRLEDFYRIFHLDRDPRWSEVSATTATQLRIAFASGGKRDPCKTGRLQVTGNLNASRVELLGERFSDGQASFDLDWTDLDASFRGFSLDVPSIALRKGGGTLLGSARVRDGGAVRGNIVGSQLPLDSVQILGDLASALDGEFSTVGEVDGSLDALAARVQTHVGSLRIGGATLRPSDLSIELKPMPNAAPKSVGTTECGHPIPPPFDPATHDPNRLDAVFEVHGQLFGGQVRSDGVRITQQKDPHASGDVELRGVDLGELGSIRPDSTLDGRLSALLHFDDLPLRNPGASSGNVQLRELWVSRDGLRIDVREARRIDAQQGRVEIPGFALLASTRGGQQGIFDVSGSLHDLDATPRSDVLLRMRPTPLSTFAAFLPRAERTSGVLSGEVKLGGPIAQTSYRGALVLEKGEISFRGSPLDLTDMNVVLAFEPGELRVVKATANLGGGTVQVTGSAPLEGFELGAARGRLIANRISVAPAADVSAQFDASLEATWEPATPATPNPLPRFTGDVTVTSLSYSRPVTLTADIATIAKRGKRTSFESYDPRNDFVDFDVRVHSAQSLQVHNNLAEASFVVDAARGLRVAGTNQRFGARGDLRFEPGGRIRLRRNQFDIRQGVLRFDDMTRLAPRLDLTAVTDYRRNASSQTGSTAGPTATSGTDVGDSGLSSGSGSWRIKLHAHGPLAAPKIDLSSEPELSQDDIFLLLTLGLTRTELNQAQSASVGGSVALEALGAITGADAAVSEAVPVIDEFRFGSAYSSRTGRTEPTVTIGKRLSERIRAYVTSSIGDAREVRSNVEWRLNRQVSVQGSYDNVNDISSSGIGNLGADVRWRLEFE